MENSFAQRLDLSITSSSSMKHRKPALSTLTNKDHLGLSTPPNSYSMDPSFHAARYLISPPPEETLRKPPKLTHVQYSPSAPVSTKRKRSLVPSLTSTEAGRSRLDALERVANTGVGMSTPNAKQRKVLQERLESSNSPTRSNQQTTKFSTPSRVNKSVTQTPRESLSPRKRLLMQSPHMLNPDADYTPAVPLSAKSSRGNFLRRRSATPMMIPPYEPPADEFVPPKEIIFTPIQSASTRQKSRTSTTKKKIEGLKLIIKKERPEVDLNKPVDPPSPSDDPLLLHGPPLLVEQRKRKTQEVGTRSKIASSPSPVVQARKRGHGSSQDYNNLNSIVSSPAMPMFDLSNPDPSPDVSGFASDSDSDGENVLDQMGDYTGEFTTFEIPIKASIPAPGITEDLGRQDAAESDDAAGPDGNDWGLKDWSLSNATADSSQERSTQEETNVEIDVGAGKPWNDMELESEGASSETPEHSGTSNDSQDVSFEPDIHLSLPSPSKEDGSGAIDEGQDRSFEFPSLPYSETRIDARELWSDDASHTSEGKDRLSFDAHPSSLESTESNNDDHSLALLPDEHASLFQSYSESERHSFGFAQDLDGITTSLSLTFATPQEPSLDFREMQDSSGRNPNEVARLSTHGSPAAHDSFSPEIQPVPSAQSPNEEPHSRGQQSQPEDESYLDKSTLSELVQEDEHSSLLRSVQGPANVVRQVAESPFPSFTRPLTLPSKPQSLTEFEGLESSNDAPSIEFPNSVVGATAVNESSSEEEGDSEINIDVVKVTSSDPNAAARAAAILKLHDYAWLPKTEKKHRRHSHANLEASRHSHLDYLESNHHDAMHRRATINAFNEKTDPGSPALSLPELLEQAEISLAQASPCKIAAQGNFRGAECGNELQDVTPGPREWTKADWKQMDACFTEERFDLGIRQGLESGDLADVDDVDLRDVVTRFVCLMGGFDVLNDLGQAWTSENLLARARSLQRKQRAGSVVLPTPQGTPASSRQEQKTPYHLLAWNSPLASPRDLPARPLFPDKPPKEVGAPESIHVPPSLLAPRYSRLLDEAIAVRDRSSPASPCPSTTHSAGVQGIDATPQPQAAMQSTPRSLTLGKRVKDVVYSYLPAVSQPQGAMSKIARRYPGLPLPPVEVLEKPRGPISTPARPPPPKPTPPKELVILQPAPPKPSLIPRIMKPRRMVELHPAPVPAPRPISTEPRPRRSSGSSVKDLVRCFEELEDHALSVKDTQLRRVRSAVNHKGSKEKPVWKP